MRLIHYSAEPLDAVHSVRQDDEPWHKPHGLWVSVDDAWKRWCEAEDYEPECLACAAEIVLMPDAKILRIGTVDVLDVFRRSFCDQSNGGWSVHWSVVAMHWAGIIINPYLHERRLDGNAHWYYGWDCACGCIWDAEAIAEVRPITPS
jgi:hypothetical protein